jgi:hypothetical protein
MPTQPTLLLQQQQQQQQAQAVATPSALVEQT